MGSIVLDKCVFQRASADALRRFSYAHAILIPYELIYELASESPGADTAGPKGLARLGKLRGIPFRVCFAVSSLCLNEIKTGRPIRAIADFGESRHLGDMLAWDDFAPDSARLGELHRHFECEIPGVIRTTLPRMQSEEHRPAFAEARQIAKGRECSVPEAYLAVTDPESINSSLREAHKQQSHPDFAPAPGWISFHLFQLLSYLCFRLVYDGVRHDGAIQDQTLARENIDLYYVALLTVADGIVTHDTRLEEIARAFFPGKRVFRNVEG